MISPLLNILSRARKARSAAVVRTVAGLPVGAGGRRGTVLVLVIGALALISVITLIYATIGQGDRRQSASNQVHADVQSTAGATADYIAQRIADGTVSVMVDGDYIGATRGATPLLVRQAADYPATDPFMISVCPTPQLTDRRFDTGGSYDTLLNPVTRRDPRIPATPFLAVTQPGSLATPADPANLTAQRDWLHISNLAPDGRFVNLWNLAPVVNNQRFSSFGALSAPPVTAGAAAPGTAPMASDDSRMQPTVSPPRSYLSFRLSLFDSGANPTGNLDFGGPADVNHPAHWDSRQQWMYRPAAGPMFFPGNIQDPMGIPANSPGSMWYPPYQYCDADGDGLFDSRWFELVDATDPDNPTSFLPKDDRFRWFVAARVIDLCSMVNVNTATSFGAPQVLPSGQVTLFGAFPSDLDLRRLLTMDDLYRQYAASPGYAGLEPPPILNGPDDYGGTLATYSPSNALQVGDRGYRALRWALRQNSESVPAAGTNLVTNGVRDFWRDDRYVYYSGFGGQAEGGYSLTNSIQGLGQSARFTAADLKELLTYWLSNNPNSTSRLEQTVDGRWDQANGGSAATAGLGPLRSNRPAAAELRGVDNAENPPPAGRVQIGQGNGLPDADAMIRSVFDVRHYITPLSWSRPLRSGVIPKPDAVTGLSAQSVLDRDIDAKVDVLGGLVKATQATVTNQDPSTVFKGYAQALLPYAWVRSNAPAPASVWDPASRLATLSFGNNAELALRTAGHMAANLIDSYDKDHTPHAYTLLIDQDKRTRIDVGGADADKFPWWNEGGITGKQGKLDFGAANLAHTMAGNPVDPATAASLGAVNIYGIEAQPFITMVGSLLMYTDAPTTASPPGDDEFAQGDAEITINGTIGGSDAMGQIIAFQLTNPFDVDIGLTDATNPVGQSRVPDTAYSDYYIQFGGDPAVGGNLYKLAGVLENATDLQPIVLHKGETRVFYCLSERLADLQTKWIRAAAPHPLPPDPVKKYAENQLGITPTAGVTYSAADLMPDGRVKPVQIRQMDPATGITRLPLNKNFFNAGSPQPNKHVLLWRVLRGSVDPAGQPNMRSNDMLVDHLRDPGPTGLPDGSTLDRRLPSINQHINGTMSAATETDPDNTGYSIVLWGSVARRKDPGINGSTPLGGIPAYCVEAKWGTTLQNVVDKASADPAALSKSDFVGGAPAPKNADDTLRKLILKLSASAAAPPATTTSVLIPDLTRQPKDWTGAGSVMPLNLDNPAQKYEDLYPVIHLNDNKFEGRPNGVPTAPLISTMRLADLLLPMGVGPICDPGVGTGTQDPDAWITLSQALALALNFDTPPTGAAAWSLYSKMGDSRDGFLDRGNLALDRGAPYEDVNASGPVHTFEGPTVAGNPDKIRWPGIPLSLNILNVFTVNEPQFGGLTQATQGLININTAPQAVLNTVPFLSPTTEPGEWTRWKTAVGVAAGMTVPEPPSGPGASDGSDVASGILAYRDRARAKDRDGHVIDFADVVATNPFNELVRDGRTQTSKIPAHRETAGFASPGEIMTVVDHGVPANQRISVPGDQIDYLARDKNPSGVVGMNTTLFKDSSGTARVDGVPDDYAEKLAIAQAALGSVTVRSDLFAVWFVVQGYQKSDTEGLGLTDPLKPSVAKRYLMIVDRSNVTHKGEKPRVLFLTELPM